MFRLRYAFFGLIACALLFGGISIAGAANPPGPVPLGTASSFAVLGGQTVTNTGPSQVSGNLGVDPGSAVTGFPPGVVSNGVEHLADAVALQAQSDTTTAYNNLAGQACTNVLTGQDLGGLTLLSGVNCFTSSAQLTGALTLNGQGNPNSVFIFLIGSTLTTASGSSVVLINGASACNVFWQIGSSATLGTTTTFVGSILALTSIALQTGTSLDGRALARNGSVTLDSNLVGPLSCQGSTPTPTSTSTATSTATAAASPTPTSTSTPTPTTPTPTASSTPMSTLTPTPTSTGTPISTMTPTPTPTSMSTTPTPTPTPGGGVKVNKDCMPKQVLPGQEVVCTITVTNAGPARNLLVTDILAAGGRYPADTTTTSFFGPPTKNQNNRQEFGPVGFSVTAGGTVVFHVSVFPWVSKSGCAHRFYASMKNEAHIDDASHPGVHIAVSTTSFSVSCAPQKP